MAKVYGDEKGFRERFADLKDQPFRVKLSYLWTYYGKIALGILAGCALIVFFVITFIRNSKPYIVEGMCLSCELSDTAADDLKTWLADRLEEDENSCNIDYTSFLVLDTDAESSVNMKIISRVAAQDLDFLVARQTVFNRFLASEDEDSEMFCDLRDLLPDDLYEALDEEDRIEYYEAEWGSFPCLILVDDSNLYSILGLSGEGQYIGIPVSYQNEDAVFALLGEIAD